MKRGPRRNARPKLEADSCVFDACSAELLHRSTAWWSACALRNPGALTATVPTPMSAAVGQGTDPKCVVHLASAGAVPSGLMCITSGLRDCFRPSVAIRSRSLHVIPCTKCAPSPNARKPDVRYFFSASQHNNNDRYHRSACGVSLYTFWRQDSLAKKSWQAWCCSLNVDSQALPRNTLSGRGINITAESTTTTGGRACEVYREAN